MLAFLNARSMEEKRRLAAEHTAILTSAAAEQVMADLLAQYAGNAEAVRIIEAHRALLRRIGEVGIEAAFEEMVG